MNEDMEIEKEIAKKKTKPYYLSPKIKIVWAFGYLLGFLLLLFVSYVLASFIESLGFRIEDIYFWIVIIALALLLPYLIYIEIYYRHYLYYLEDKGIVVQKGIIKKEEYVVPYEKIQKVHIYYDILPRILGIGRVVIETASPTLPKVELEGIDEAEKFVRDLLRRVDIAKGLSTEEENIYDEIIASFVRLSKKIEGLESKINEFENKVMKLEEKLLNSSNSKTSKKSNTKKDNKKQKRSKGGKK